MDCGKFSTIKGQTDNACPYKGRYTLVTRDIGD